VWGAWTIRATGDRTGRDCNRVDLPTPKIGGGVPFTQRDATPTRLAPLRVASRALAIVMRHVIDARDGRCHIA